MKPSEQGVGLQLETGVDVGAVEKALHTMRYPSEVALEPGAVLDEEAARAIKGLHVRAGEVMERFHRGLFRHPIKYLGNRVFREEVQTNRDAAQQKLATAADWEQKLNQSRQAAGHDLPRVESWSAAAWTRNRS